MIVASLTSRCHVVVALVLHFQRLETLCSGAVVDFCVSPPVSEAAAPCLAECARGLVRMIMASAGFSLSGLL